VKYFIKYSIKQLAFYTRLLPKEQFWGYLRTRKEYQNAILNAGFTTFDDGFLSDGTYWIKGICK
jgi:hypothetical protein